MSSVGPIGRGLKQGGGFFIPLENLTAAGKILQYTAGTGAGGSYVAGGFANSSWATSGTSVVKFTSSISAIGAGGLLRDMGKTVVSAGRTFRKIQLMCSTVSTGGVAGTGTGAVTDFLVGYIELGSGLNAVSPGGSFAAVAYYPALM
jgi:hypothetical protein